MKKNKVMWFEFRLLLALNLVAYHDIGYILLTKWQIVFIWIWFFLQIIASADAYQEWKAEKSTTQS